MTWIDVTYKSEAAAELTDMPDGRVEISWPMVDGSRFTVLVARAEFATLVEQGRALLAPAAVPA